MKCPSRLLSSALLASALLTGGCSETDTLAVVDSEVSPRQHVGFDWSLDPWASPAGMRLWLYPDDWEGSPMPLDIPGRNGGEVAITPGHYHVISYNNDTEWIIPTATENYSGHSLATRDAGILEPLGIRNSRSMNADSTERVAAYPEPVWACNCEADIKADSQLTMHPQPLVGHYSFTFEDVGSTAHVAKASASISGMAASVNLSTLQADTAQCIHPLRAVVNAQDSTISGEFYSFGASPASGRRNRMALYLVMDNGEAYKFTQGSNLDVTDQIDTAPDPQNVEIRIKGVRIPGTGTSESEAQEFEVNVDDWGSDVKVNIPI